MPYTAFVHSHVTSWAVALILFVIAIILVQSGKKKAVKIVQMILRLFYVLILITGVYLLVQINFQNLYILKGVLAFWLIYTMEMILVRSSKGELTGSRRLLLWAQFVIILLLILFIGYGIIQ